MKIYIKKTGKTSFIIYKETTTQSILSDLLTILVWIVLIGSDILFSIYFIRSAVFDCMIVILFGYYVFSAIGERKKQISDDELKAMLEDSIEQ